MSTMNIFDMTDTWNAGATTFTAIKMNATDTASAAGSMLIDLQLGGTSLFRLTKVGNLTYGATGASTNFIGTVFNFNTNACALYFRNGDTPITSPTTATLQLGLADAAAPVAQTLRAQGSRSGTDTNIGGANLTIQPGTGTGTGTISTLILRSPVAVGSGTGAQTQTTGLTIRAGTAVMTSYTVAALPTAATAGAGARAFVTDALTPVFGSEVVGSGAVGVPVYSTGSAWNVG